MSGIQVGQVTHYYEHLQVAVLALSEPIHVGDYVYIAGHTTSIHQKVTSLQIDHQPVSEALAGQDVALKVIGRVRVHDAVYRSTAEETEQAQKEELVELLKSQ